MSSLAAVLPLGDGSYYNGCYNGGEYAAHDVRTWLQRMAVRTLYIEPGSPWDNCYIESSDARFRLKCPNEHWLLSLADAREKVET